MGNHLYVERKNNSVNEFTLKLTGLVDCVSNEGQTALERALELAKEMSSGGQLFE